MMDQLTEEEKFLLLGKVTGTLSQEEEQALERLFCDNPYALHAYKVLTESLPVEDVTTGFARHKEKRVWRDLTTEFRERQRSLLPESRGIRFFKKWMAAAILIGVLATGAWLWYIFGKPGRTDIATFPGKPRIELKLSNGNVINLSQLQGNIQIDAVQLSNRDKTLTYSPGSGEVASMNTLTVPIGLDYKINLADGSEVWLNSATRLDFPFVFSDSSREITISGEAYLKVARDATRPFIVHLPGSSVQVLGTEFNVNTYYPGVVKVALVEGSVNIQTSAGESKIVPGKQVVYQSGQPLTLETFDVRRILSWRQGLFYFKDANLDDISQVVYRWYGIQVVIDDPAIRPRRFTGVINRNRPISAFLDDLKVISEINSYFDNKNVLHFK